MHRAAERSVDVDQVLHATDFRAKNNLIRTQAVFFGKLGGVERADDHGFHGNFAGVLWLGQAGVLVHHASEQGLIERSPVDADAHRLLILDRDFNHGGEVVIVLTPDADVAGIDPILSQGPCTLRKLLKQEVAIVMKVADDGDGDALLGEFVDDGGYAGGGVFGVHRYSDQFGSGSGQGGYLLDGRGDVRGIRVRHRLHHYWCIGADADVADGAGYGFSAVEIGHGKLYFSMRGRLRHRGHRGSQRGSKTYRRGRGGFAKVAKKERQRSRK